MKSRTSEGFSSNYELPKRIDHKFKTLDSESCEEVKHRTYDYKRHNKNSATQCLRSLKYSINNKENRVDNEAIPRFSSPDFQDSKSRTFKSINIKEYNTNEERLSKDNGIAPYNSVKSYRINYKEASPQSPREVTEMLLEKSIPKGGRSNWYSKEYVEEMQKFYQVERENLKDRIDRIYQENDNTKISLIDQVDELKNKLSSTLNMHKEEIVNLNNTHSRELTRIINDKDTFINRLQNQIAELRNDLSQLTLRYTDLKDENKRFKIEHDTHIESLSQQIKTQCEIYESQKEDLEYRNNSLKERYEYDRVELKQEYDRLISSIREENLKSQNDLCEVIKAK